MEQKKRVIVFFQNHMVVGGVETYIYDQAKRLVQQGWQIIWVRKNACAKLDSTMADVFAAPSTIVWNRRINEREMSRLLSDGNAEITIVTFNMYQFAQAERFKKRFGDYPVHTFLFMPHYKGEALFFEENHQPQNRDKIRTRMGQIYQKMNQYGNLRYFNVKQMKITSENYGYEIADTNEAFVPPRKTEGAVFDENRCRKLAERERFNLLTVSRFDFPHKGYVLGLIRAYGELKLRYPRLELTIVGYGRDLPRVEQTIAALAEMARKDVHMVGKVSPSQLDEYYNDANLNVSVASCCSQGARNGTLSIPARHYDENCEVYGFLPESKLLTVSEQPGEPVIGYIEQVLNMACEEYCRRCREGFAAYNEDYAAVRIPMEKIKNTSCAATLSAKDIRFIERQEFRRELRSKKRGAVRVLKKIVKKLFKKG